MKTFVIQTLATVLACAGTAAGQTSTGPASGPQVTTATVPPPSLISSSPPQTGCPTVTATRELCYTCVVPACLALSTVTQSCGCPTPAPTVYLDFPCASGCAGLGCSTQFAVLPAEGTCTGAAGNLSSVPSPTLGGTTTTTDLGATSFPVPSISAPPNGTSVTVSTRVDASMSPPTSATQSGPPINAAGRPRPFRLWL